MLLEIVISSQWIKWIQFYKQHKSGICINNGFLCLNMSVFGKYWYPLIVQRNYYKLPYFFKYYIFHKKETHPNILVFLIKNYLNDINMKGQKLIIYIENMTSCALEMYKSTNSG